MYLYSTDGLGECDVTKKSTVLGPGLDPRTDAMNPKTGLCHLIQDPTTGRFTDWQDYVGRTRKADDPVSKFKKFREEDCYKDFQKRFCVPATKPAPQPIQPKQSLPPELVRAIVEALTKIPWPQLQTQTPQVPPAPKTLKMRDL